jgi:hypothetical protein
MKIRVMRSGFLFACLLFALTTTVLSQGSGVVDYNYVPPALPVVIDAPGAGTGAIQGTIAIGIDTTGDVAGTYIDGSGTSHGFVFSASGTMTTFDVSGAGTGKNQGTFVTAMDTIGDVTGYYSVALYGLTHGFIRAANGAITSFDATTGGGNTAARGINSIGAVTGNTYGPGGFVRSASGVITTFAVPVPGQPSSDVYSTTGIAINTAGVVAGRYSDYTGVSHGYVRSANGTITSFDPPNVATTNLSTTRSVYNEYVGTLPTSIDTAGDIAGTYTDTNGARHGFVRAASGAITVFDVPGADTSPCASSGMGVLMCGSGSFTINDAGEIVGAYMDVDNVGHGFLRAANGSITSFDAPGAGTGSYQGTGIFAINAAGTIAGTYLDTNSVLHGFVGTVAPAATTATLTASQSASVFNEPASFTATVSSSSGTPPNGESVFFTNGLTQLGSATLSGGSASFTTTALPVGTDSVTASYTGDSNFAGSTSAAVSQTVGKATSFTALTSSPNPSALQQSVTLTAAVSGQFGGTATGMVTFSNGATTLGTAPLSGNAAVLPTTALSAGTDSITAVYSGDSNFGASTSNTVSQVVTGPAATPIFSVSSGTYTATQTVSISDTTTNATVYYTTNGTTPTTGSTLYTGAITVSTTETIQAIAVASGYSNSAIASATYTINLPAPDFSVAASPASFTVTAGQSGTTTVTLTPLNGFNSAVSFSCSGLPTGATCSFSPSTVTPPGSTSTTLTVATPTTAAALHRNSAPLFPATSLAVALCCFGWKKRRRLQMLVLLAVSVAGLTLLNGCGGASSTMSAPPPVTSTVTVTAASGSLQHAGTFSLTVN